MIERPKVLIYTDCYVYGGSERLMTFLVRNPILKQNFDFILAYRRHKIYEQGLEKEYGAIKENRFLRPLPIISNFNLFHKIQNSNIPNFLKILTKLPFFILESIGVYFVCNFISFCLALKAIKPGIIHINNGGYPGAKACNTLVLTARFLGFKNIIYQINNIAQPTSNFFAIRKDRYIDKNVECFIVASGQAGEKLVSERNFSQDKIIRVPNTVIEERASIDRNALLGSLSIDNKAFIIVVVAFLSKRKGQQYLLSALKIIREQDFAIYENLKILLVGDGEEEGNLKRYVDQQHLQSSVHFLGFRSNAIDFIDACDLLVLPSISNEDMPLTILTAMNRGKRILATDFAGIREEIENGVSGILVSPDTSNLAENLSKEIVKLYNYRNDNYGSQAMIRYNKLFSNEVYGNKLTEIYATILKKHQR